MSRATLPNWYAIRTRSNYERRVAEQLSSKGIESYLPSFAEMHSWKDRRKLVEVPVFRGYVFGRFVVDDFTRLSVLRSDGVVRILGCGSALAPVPCEEIEAVRKMLATAASRCHAHPLLQAGAWVRIKRGPLKDVEGVLVRVKSQARLVVSITLLSQSVSTEIDVSDVEVLRSARFADRPAA
jgi:transcription termination/antitermination protein NusG